MTIWQFQRLLSMRLLAWNILNFTAGLILTLNKNRYVQGVGSQFAGWAFINVLIANMGAISAARRERTLPDAHTVEREITEARNLRRLLWVNAGLDVLYMVGGIALLMRKNQGERTRGMGLGIIFQGVFLFIFDVTQANDVPDPTLIDE